MAHTPGPLESQPDGNEFVLISDNDYRPVAMATVHEVDGNDLGDSTANADELVRRWNAFEPGGIVAELVDTLTRIDNLGGSNAEMVLSEVRSMARAALARYEEMNR